MPTVRASAPAATSAAHRKLPPRSRYARVPSRVPQAQRCSFPRRDLPEDNADSSGNTSIFTSMPADRRRGALASRAERGELRQDIRLASSSLDTRDRCYSARDAYSNRSPQISPRTKASPQETYSSTLRAHQEVIVRALSQRSPVRLKLSAGSHDRASGARTMREFGRRPGVEACPCARRGEHKRLGSLH